MPTAMVFVCKKHEKVYVCGCWANIEVLLNAIIANLGTDNHYELVEKPCPECEK